MQVVTSSLAATTPQLLFRNRCRPRRLLQEREFIISYLDVLTASFICTVTEVASKSPLGARFREELLLRLVMFDVPSHAFTPSEVKQIAKSFACRSPAAVSPA